MWLACSMSYNWSVSERQNGSEQRGNAIADEKSKNTETFLVTVAASLLVPRTRQTRFNMHEPITRAYSSHLFVQCVQICFEYAQNTKCNGEQLGHTHSLSTRSRRSLGKMHAQRPRWRRRQRRRWHLSDLSGLEYSWIFIINSQSFIWINGSNCTRYSLCVWMHTTPSRSLSRSFLVSQSFAFS